MFCNILGRYNYINEIPVSNIILMKLADTNIGLKTENIFLAGHNFIVTNFLNNETKILLIYFKKKMLHYDF